MDYKILKNRQTAILAVFGQFLDGFWAVFGGFGGYIVLYIISNILRIFTCQTGQFTNHGLSKFEKLPNHYSDGFLTFLGGFWADFGGFGSYMVLFIISILMKPPKTAQKPPKTTQKLSKNRQNSGLEVFEILKIHDLWIGQFGR